MHVNKSMYLPYILELYAFFMNKIYLNVFKELINMHFDFNLINFLKTIILLKQQLIKNYNLGTI